tara:strand:- start:10006 stop:10203 length:198 start_codon:yes stop_codon:yes gene_type:complete
MNKIRKDFLNKIGSEEIIEINSILDKVNEFGLTVEVIYTALNEIKSNPNTTPLLAIQIAANDWDC